MTRRRALISQDGATATFLPAYSPDWNPIELMWSNVKQFLRGAEARAGEALVAAIATALASVTVQDAANWFAHCGDSLNNMLQIRGHGGFSPPVSPPPVHPLGGSSISSAEVPRNTSSLLSASSCHARAAS